MILPLLRRLRGFFAPALFLATLPVLQGCSMMFPPTLKAPRAGSLPVIDGAIDDAWLAAPALRVEARGNTLKNQNVPVELKALHDGDRVAFLLRWEDDTPSASVREIEWSEAGEPMTVGVPDDQMALKFNLGGSRFSCMLAGKPVTSDVWSWKAGRTDPAGYAQDRLFIVRAVEDEASAASVGIPYRALNGDPIEIVWQEDAGDPLLLPHAPAGTPGASEPEVVVAAPTGSQADVRAKGVWRNGLWTLEIARTFDTGHADDAPIAPDAITKFSLAVFDASEGQVHANTRSIKLKPQP